MIFNASILLELVKREEFKILSDKILKKDNAYKKVKLYNTNFSIIDIFKTGKILKEDLNKKQKLIYPVKY